MTKLGRASVFISCGVLVAIAASGCASKDNTARAVGGFPAAAGTASNETSGGGNDGMGAASNGGSTGATTSSGGNGTGGTTSLPSCMVLPVQNATLTEFTPPEAPAAGGASGDDGAGGEPAVAAPTLDKISFGYDADPPTVASGYSFFYPEASLKSDMSAGTWHVSGNVADYAGFQIAFVCGADAKAFKGISFKVSGDAGPSGAITFVVAHASDSWRNPASTEPSAASCASPNQYDGTCTEAQAVVTVEAEEATVSLLWEDIGGGKPEQHPDPSELLALRWLFKWDQAYAADAAAHQYDVDVSIDDVKFIE